MKNIRNRSLVLLICILALSLALVGCQSSDVSTGDNGIIFPEPGREIRIVVPFSPGGGFDIQARGIAPFLEKYIGTPVIIENMPGAGGLMATQHVWNAKPDGYVILQSQISAVMIEQFLNPDGVRFSMPEFSWIGQYQEDIRAVAVRTELAVDSWDELVELSKERPLLAGTTGIGSGAHREASYLSTVAGLDMDYVHYSGSNDTQGGFARGECDLVVLNFNSLMRWEEEGDAKTLFVIANDRMELVPNVPTAVEYGMKADIALDLIETPIIGTPRGFAAPPETPDEVLAVLRDAFQKAMEDPEYHEWLKSADQITGPTSGEELAETVKSLELKMESIVDFIKEMEDDK